MHLGCGYYRLPGFINIDLRNTPAVDVICDVTRLPYKNSTINEIKSFHVIEHLPRLKAEQVLTYWYGLLKPDGLLVLECPDFDRAVTEYLNGADDRLGNIFGLQRFPNDYHLWGWNDKRLSEMLKSIGFVSVEFCVAQDYHTKDEPCIRLEARKPDALKQ